MDWGPKVPPFASCAFINQLRKEGKAFVTAGGRSAMMASLALKSKSGSGAGDAVGDGDGRKGRKRKASLLETKKQSAMSITAAAFRPHPLSATLGDEEGGADATLPPAVRTLDDMHLKYPMDDTKYWELVLSFGGENPLPPLPYVPTHEEEDMVLTDGEHVFQERRVNPLSSNPQQLGRLLGVWTSVNNFRSFFSSKVLAPLYITLEAMESTLAERR